MSSCVAASKITNFGVRGDNIPIGGGGDANCDTSPTGLVQIFNTITASAISQTITSCFSTQTAEQLVRLRCNPKLPESESVYEENHACGVCVDSILKSGLLQMQIQRKLWQNSPATVLQPIDNFYISLLGQMKACATYCKACSFSNLTQVNTVNSDNSCITSNMNSTNIESNLNTNIQQFMLSNQDVLSAFNQTLGIKSVQSISQFITDKITTVVNSEFLNLVQSSLQQSQVLEVYSESSVQLGSISQSSTSVVIQRLVDSNSITTNALGEELISSISELINSQNSLNSLGNVIIDSTISFLDCVSGIAGQLMLASIVILGLAVVAILVYFIYTNVKNLIERNAQKKLNQGV